MISPASMRPATKSSRRASSSLNQPSVPSMTGGTTLDHDAAGPVAADGRPLAVEVCVEGVARGGVDEPAGFQQGARGRAGHLGGQALGGGPYLAVGRHPVGQAAGGELGGGDAAV